MCDLGMYTVIKFSSETSAGLPVVLCDWRGSNAGAVGTTITIGAKNSQSMICYCEEGLKHF